MQESKLLSANEVAERLGISVPTVYRLAHRRDGLRTLKVGASLRFRPSDVEAYLAAAEIKPPERQASLPGMKRFQYRCGMKVVDI